MNELPYRQAIYSVCNFLSQVFLKQCAHLNIEIYFNNIQFVAAIRFNCRSCAKAICDLSASVKHNSRNNDFPVVPYQTYNLISYRYVAVYSPYRGIWGITTLQHLLINPWMCCVVYCISLRVMQYVLNFIVTVLLCECGTVLYDRKAKYATEIFQTNSSTQQLHAYHHSTPGFTNISKGSPQFKV